MAAAIVAAACDSSKEPAARVAASSTAPAGRVLEVSGTVTVAGKPLAKNDTVRADAVIETGADGNVVIQLVHNLARWELGPNKHVRVDASLAWKEPKRTEPVAQVNTDTTSAGRPAERNAAGTVAGQNVGIAETTVAASDESPKKADEAPPRPKPDPKAKGEGSKDVLGADGDGFGEGGLGLSGTGQGGGGTGEGTIGIGHIGTISKSGGTGTGTGYGAGNGGTRGKQGKAPVVREGQAQVQGQLAPEVIRRVVRRTFGRLRACYENGLKANPTLDGRITVKFVIAKDGAVATAQDAGSTIKDSAVISCVVGAFKGMAFPAPEGDGVVVVTYPLTFNPAR
jgi:hypothetical protein